MVKGKSNHKSNKNFFVKNIRSIILGLFFVLFSYLAVKHMMLGGNVDGSPSVDALCPFGAVESIITFIMSGAFLQRIYASNFILAGILLILAVVFTRGFCGWMCPFGAASDFFSKVGAKIFGKRFKFSNNVDKYLKYVKYFILVLVVIGSFQTASLIFRGYDPFITLFHFGDGVFYGVEEGEFLAHSIPFVILVLVMVGALFIDRFWCKYLCPLGGFLAGFFKIGQSKINRNTSNCTDCKACDKKCPVDIEVSKADKVNSAECLSCMRCTESCNFDALDMKLFGKAIKGFTFGLSLIGVFFGLLFIFMGIGLWSSLPGDITDVDVNHFDIGTIKGYTTIGQIATLLEVDVDTLIVDLNLSDSVNGDTQLKDIKTIDPERAFETDEVRILVAEKYGIVYVPVEH